MRKDLAVLIGALAVLVVVYLVAEKPFSRATPDELRDARLVFPEFSPQDARAIAVHGPKHEFRLERSGDEWLIAGERTMYADSTKVQTALRLIAELSTADLVSIVPDKHSVFEVDDEQGTHVVVEAKDDVLAECIIGRRGPDYLSAYFRIPGQDEVYLSQRGLASNLLREQDHWRDRKVMHFDRDAATSITVERGTDKIVLDRTGEEEWRVVEPMDAAADESAVRRLLLSLSNMSALGFEDEKTPAECGLEEPATVVTVELGDAPPKTILVGSRDERTYFVRRSDRETIYRVSSPVIERIPAEAKDVIASESEEPDRD